MREREGEGEREGGKVGGNSSSETCKGIGN